MALKDITLGQYFPGHTILHRMDPRTKILLTTLYIVALFLCKQVVSYALVIAVLAGAVAISHVGLKSIVRGMRPVLIIVILTAVLNLFYTPGQELWRWGFLRITVEGIWAAVFMVLRITLLITCAYLCLLMLRQK